MNRLCKVNTTFESYQDLINFFQNNIGSSNIHIKICDFFAANMSAVLGAILDKFTSNLNNIHFDYLSSQIETIYEIFLNAKTHSETEFIYTCGQFFPNKNKIEFTVVDTGIGFKNKINQRFGKILTACQAIKSLI